MAKDKRVDEYIAKALPFAQPILQHLRALIHEAIPEIEETVKWGMPAFYYKGPICNIAAFKQHVVFGLWKQELIQDPKAILQKRAMQGGDAMGHLGRITSLQDLPNYKDLIDILLQAKLLNENNIKLPSKPKKEILQLEIPDYFQIELNKNTEAKVTFEKFSNTNKKEYLEWVCSAKTDKTRQERLITAIEWMAEGKVRNWKYVKK